MLEKHKHVHGPDCDHENEHGGHVHGPDCNHDHDHKYHSETFVRSDKKLGRNDPCHCGSGQKFKKCHGKNE